MTRHDGFTLLEVTLVVLLLGLLAALVVPRLSGRTLEARRARAAADLHGIAQALEGYRLDAGAYPTTAQGLEALVRAPSLPPRPARWRPDAYLLALPRDPWGHDYAYTSPDGRRFTLRSLGGDGEPGGDGEAADVEHDAF